MSKIRLTLAFFVVSLLCSCINKQLVKEIEEFKGQQVTVPKDCHTIWKGKDTLLFKFSDAPVKMVVWFDSLSCASCQIVKMFEWGEITTYANSFEEWFRVIFLFTPQMEDFYEASSMLKIVSFAYPVFIDQNASFIEFNPKLPKNRQLHTFLLDKNNKVVLVGSPLHNPSLWKLYQRTIQTMIANDGALPEK